jgi:adenylate kinase
LFFKESDYHLRVPLEKYQHLKTLETLAMSSVKTQPKLKVHVLCSGIRYGCGERSFESLFKWAWLQDPRALPTFPLEHLQKGKNLIPTIHIIDLARVVRRIVQDRVTKQYIFAIDRTVRPT